MKIGTKAISMKFGLVIVALAVVLYVVKFRKKNGAN